MTCHPLLSRTVGTAIVALSLSFTAQPAAAAPHLGQESGTVGIAAETPITPQIIQWSPHDGAQINDKPACLRRLNHVKSVRPDIRHGNCSPFYTAQCPPAQKWLVMVGYDNLLVAAPSESLFSPTPDARRARC